MQNVIDKSHLLQTLKSIFICSQLRHCSKRQEKIGTSNQKKLDFNHKEQVIFCHGSNGTSCICPTQTKQTCFLNLTLYSNGIVSLYLKGVESTSSGKQIKLQKLKRFTSKGVESTSVEQNLKEQHLRVSSTLQLNKT